MDLFPDDERLHRWLRMARAERAGLQDAGGGSVAGVRQAGAGRLAFNRPGHEGPGSAAPIVIGRDPPGRGSVASPHRETEGMAAGSDELADGR